MASEKQIDANRQNALRSTGPRTAEGKERSARNATRSGMWSRDALLPGEDPQEFDALLADVLAEVDPMDVLDVIDTYIYVSCQWRLLRLWRIEADLLGAHLTGESKASLGRAYARERRDQDYLGKMGRDEARLIRQRDQAMNRVERRKAARQGVVVEPPMVVDVNVNVADLNVSVADEVDALDNIAAIGTEPRPACLEV